MPVDTITQARNAFNRAYNEAQRKRSKIGDARRSASLAVTKMLLAERDYDIACGQELPLSRYLEKQTKEIKELYKA